MCSLSDQCSASHVLSLFFPVNFASNKWFSRLSLHEIPLLKPERSELEDIRWTILQCEHYRTEFLTRGSWLSTVAMRANAQEAHATMFTVFRIVWLHPPCEEGIQSKSKLKLQLRNPIIEQTGHQANARRKCPLLARSKWKPACFICTFPR